MTLPHRHRVLGAIEAALLIGILLAQGAFLLSVIDLAARHRRVTLQAARPVCCPLPGLA